MTLRVARTTRTATASEAAAVAVPPSGSADSRGPILPLGVETIARPPESSAWRDDQ